MQKWEEKLFQSEGIGGRKAKQYEQDKVFWDQMWLEIYSLRRISIMYFVPLEFWSGKKIIKPTYVSQSESIVVKLEMDRRKYLQNEIWDIESDNE